MMAKRNMHRLLVGKPEGEKLLGKARHIWVGNIGKRGWGEGIDWIDLAQERDK
jgi:hypothetical protein